MAKDGLEEEESAVTESLESPPQPAPKHRQWAWRLALLVAMLAAGLAWPRLKQVLPNKPAAPTAAERTSALVPVSTQPARKSQVNIYLNGLGVVTPIYTVTVKSRVDGQLMEVAYKEGQIVQKGDLLVQIDPRPYQVQVAQAEGQLNKDQAVLENARTDLARYQKLWSQNAIPQQQLATQQAMVAQNEATIRSDQAQIDAARLNLEFSRIIAPITGRVGLRLVDPGNIVHAGDNTALVVITQLQPISVIFTIAEDQLQGVLNTMRAGKQMPVEAWDREMKIRLASGALVTLDNEIDQATGTLKLRAQFENANGALFPNQFVNARMLLQQKAGVTVAPLAAIQRNAESAYVYLVQPDHSVAVRPVTVGTVEGDVAEIASGISPGDVLVTEGVDKLQPGVKVVERSDEQHGGAPRREPN